MKKNSLKIFNIYFLISIIYYCLGRYRWNIPSYPKLLLYIFLCYLLLNIGYSFSWKGKGILRRGLTRSYPEIDVDYSSIRMLFWISAISIIVFQIVWVIVFFNRFSISNVFSLLGDNYYARLDTTFNSSILIMQIRTLFWGITLFAYPIGFMFYKKMPLIDKIMFALTIFIDVVAGLNMGMSKNIGDIVIAFLGVTLLKNAVNTSTSAHRKNRKGIIRVTCIIIAFLIVFNVIQNLRNSVTTSNLINPYGSLASIRENNIFYLLFGSNSTISLLIDKIGLYISHGYTGLAFALELPFKNTYLLGFSRSLMEYADQYLGLNLADLTYNARIETQFGWLNGQWWPSAFTWIGNAVSMWLVPFVLLVMGVFIRHLEDDFGQHGNIITAVLYVQMIITVMYLPCNMQIFQSRTSLMGSIMLFVLFFFREKMKNNRTITNGRKTTI
ncbi:hypothetical protein ACVS9P_10265 [Caproicibacterium sp. NSD3]